MIKRCIDPTQWRHTAVARATFLTERHRKVLYRYRILRMTGAALSYIDDLRMVDIHNIPIGRYVACFAFSG